MGFAPAPESVWKRGRPLHRRQATYLGAVTNEAVGHVGSHRTSPSIQARLLGTHIQEGFTVTALGQKISGSFKRYEY